MLPIPSLQVFEAAVPTLHLSVAAAGTALWEVFGEVA